jgi:pimeloyl-ACP methyl ester carboxylesterase
LAPLVKDSTGVFSFQGDARFGYCLYVPPPERWPVPRGLVVSIHDSAREFMTCRDGFVPFARRHGLVVLAPLFPINVLGNGSGDGYKSLLEGSLRYDLLLNDIVREVRRLTHCTGPFFLHGYSGGAQYVHRYLLLHPHAVKAAVIGAPGDVTLLDESHDWPDGLGRFEALFGRRAGIAALQGVPILMLVGDRDTQPHGSAKTASVSASSVSRIERTRRLAQSFRERGIPCRLSTLRGMTHDDGLLPSIVRAARFFVRCSRQPDNDAANGA